VREGIRACFPGFTRAFRTIASRFSSLDKAAGVCAPIVDNKIAAITFKETRPIATAFDKSVGQALHVAIPAELLGNEEEIINCDSAVLGMVQRPQPELYKPAHYLSLADAQSLGCSQCLRMRRQSLVDFKPAHDAFSTFSHVL